MGKIIKKYNEATGVWEPILTPDVSITQVLEDGDNITDANVIVTNENYSSDDLENPATLDETLTVISDDISKLQRNVSWLAKHGTGGGGGGGSYNVSYGFEVTYKNGNETLPLEKGQAIYTEGNQVAVTVTVTGGTTNDISAVVCQYGGNRISKNLGAGEPFTFTVTFEKSATVIISGTNPQGMPISAFNFTVYKSALSIKFNTQAAGGNYDPGSNVYQISMNAQSATIPLLVTNGLGAGSTIEYTLTSLEDDGIKAFFSEACNTDTEHPSGAVNLWALPGAQKTPGKIYLLSISAVARIGSVVTPESKINLRVRIINPSSLNLTMSVNGYFDPFNPVRVELDTSMNVSFRAYAPNKVKTVYYAGKIERSNGESIKIYGKYFDENLKDSPDSTIADNDSVKKDVTILTPPYSLVEGLFSENEIVTLTIRAWNIEENMSAETSQRIEAIAMSGFFPRQYGKRRNDPGEKNDVMFASWNVGSTPSSDKMTWYSTVYGYAPVDDTIDSEDITIAANVINGNGYSGIKSGPTRMRLQNNAYLKISIPQEHRVELEALSQGADASLSNYNGYVISITFKADETPLADRVVMLWGQNNSDGMSLATGIKITNSSVKWNVSNNTSIECKMSGGEKHTVDFVLDRRVIEYEDDGVTIKDVYSLAKIYINGILNGAQKVIGELYPYINDIYIGSNFHNGATGNTCDMSLYEFSIYTDLLTDTQIVVNGKNARIESREDEIDDYNAWKVKNLLFLTEGTNDVYSKFDAGEFDFDYITTQIAPNSDIPTMALSFNSTSQDSIAGFTSDYFYDSYDDKSKILPPLPTSSSYYYDPSTQKLLEGTQWNVELQGTSTLTYKVKNLEIYTTERADMEGTNSDGEPWPVLFQPKENWFPERQFTLKADVVDSAHANNTVIGQWINECSILDSTPPMQQLETNRPADIDAEGNQIKNEYNEDAKNTDVKIKHTTEGFPILLFISFAGKNDYTFVGIYSFNLGRYSYYNLGLKFLSSFSRYESREEMLHPTTETECPRLIRRYEETRQLGTLNVENVYSYEFDNLGSDPDPLHPVWTQYGVRGDGYQLLDAYGEFKYGDDNPEIRASLSSLMEAVATSPLSLSIFNNLHNYTLSNNGGIISDHGLIVPESSSYEVVGHKLHLKNAAAYFVIANAFGMTDSLGKNMTLRTWDGVKWYTCFYDMDTALGLDNTGSESISTNAAIDYIYYGQNGIVTVPHSDAIYVDPDGNEVPYDPEDKTQRVKYRPPYAAYKSKLWALIRATNFLYSCGETDRIFADKTVPSSPYIMQWMALRKGPLSTADIFSNIVSQKVGTCGELVYNKDYDSKYIKDSDTTAFLHGTRVEYIRKWLRDHFYFLDGYFDINTLSAEYRSTDGIVDSPYYKEMFSFGAFRKPAGGSFPLKITSTIPTFFSVGIMNASTKYYIEEAGVEKEFTIEASSNASTQLLVYGSSLFTKIEGLGSVFERIMPDSKADCLESLMVFNAPSAALKDAPFNRFKDCLDVDHGGQLEIINISNAHFDNDRREVLDLGGLTKVLRIDVSNTNLGSLILPDSSLDVLNVSNSTISSLALNGQNKLESVPINGCEYLGEYTIENCAKIGNISVTNKTNLRYVKFDNNASMSAITIDNCKALTGITISSNQSLESITIQNCENLQSVRIFNNKNLKYLTINKCENTTVGLSLSVTDASLKDIILSDIVFNGPLTLPSKDKMASVEVFKLRSCTRFRGIIYDGSELEIYEEGETDDPNMKFVLDLSPMTNLNKRGNTSETSLTIYNTDVRYIRVRNEEDNPLRLYSNTFEQSKNISRIFGHIEITNGFSFSNYNNFYINHDSNFVPTTYPSEFSFETIVSGEYRDMLNQCAYLYENSAPAFVDDEYYTNISLDRNIRTLKEMFLNTSCDIHDAYYVLQLCNPNITSLNGTFQGCSQLHVGETEWLDINMFAKCTNVTNIDSIFNNCRIDCVIIPKPFEPLVGNLTKFDYVFSSDDGGIESNYALLAVGECFFPENNKITEIMGFNPKVIGWDYDNMQVTHDGSFDDSSLLSTLTKLVTLDNCFNRCAIDFTRGTYDATELFKFNTDLESIRSSFRRVSGVGSLRNIFGGESDDMSLYPRKLKNVLNSFTFEGDCSHHSEMFPGDPTDGDGILMPIGNRLFRSVPGLEYLTGSMYGDNKTNQDYHTEYNETDSFVGPGLLKYLDNIPVSDGESYHTTPDCNEDGFPHDILRGLTNLKEMTGLFDGVRNFRGYTDANGTPALNVNILEYNGESMFKDCRNLQNISKFFRNMDPSIVCSLSGKAFKNCNLVNIDQLFSGTRLTGEIPFGLFYQADVETRENNETYEVEKQTIETMVSVFSGIKEYSGFTHYVADYHDLVMDNPDYSSGAEAGTKNSFKKIWNLYAYDGSASVDFNALMNQAISEYGANLYTGENPFAPYMQHVDSNWQAIDLSIMNKATGYEFNNDNYARMFTIPNYFCPPDIFKYCRNWDNLDISRALSKVSGEFKNGVFSGLHGRIPEMIFKPLTSIVSANEIFSEDISLFPYTWYRRVNGEAVKGLLYPPTLFDGLTLQRVNGMFATTRVWPEAIVPSNFFTPISTTLRFINDFWSTATWVEKYTGQSDSQLPNNLFNDCRKLLSVNGMLGQSQANSIAVINSALFKKENNNSIKSCVSFLINASATHGSLPPFWTFDNLPPQDNTGNVIGAFGGCEDSDNFSNLYELLDAYGGQTDVNPYLKTNS